MGSKDIQRSVRSSRHERSAGDAPNLGRVPRMPGAGLPRGMRRRRRTRRPHKDDSRRIRVLKVWMGALSGVALLVLGFMTASAILSGRSNESTKVHGSRPVEPLVKRVESKFESPSNEEALALVKRGMAAREPAEIAKSFRLGGIAPADAAEQLVAIAGQDTAAARMTWLSSVDANGLLLEAVLLTHEAEDGVRQRLALLTPDENGKWQIDFGAFARSVEPSWERILDGSAEEATVRVIAAPDSYYNGPYRDETAWSCFSLASPDVTEILRAYCPRGSAQERAMLRIVSPGGISGGTTGPRRVTLKLRREEGAAERQFRVERVMAEDWVVSEPWYDERFN